MEVPSTVCWLYVEKTALCHVGGTHLIISSPEEQSLGFPREEGNLIPECNAETLPECPACWSTLQILDSGPEHQLLPEILAYCPALWMSDLSAL